MEIFSTVKNFKILSNIVSEHTSSRLLYSEGKVEQFKIIKDIGLIAVVLLIGWTFLATYLKTISKNNLLNYKLNKASLKIVLNCNMVMLSVVKVTLLLIYHNLIYELTVNKINAFSLLLANKLLIV